MWLVSRSISESRINKCGIQLSFKTSYTGVELLPTLLFSGVRCDGSAPAAREVYCCACE